MSEDRAQLLLDLQADTNRAVSSHRALAETYPEGDAMRLHHRDQASFMLAALRWTMKLAENSNGQPTGL